MTPPDHDTAGLIWATRGRTWGFRFLRDGGLPDPLAAYEAAFAPIGDEPEGWCRTTDAVALRFGDPEGRRDAAGRIIPHDVVLLGARAEGIDSLEVGRQRTWPALAEEYAQVWDRPDASG